MARTLTDKPLSKKDRMAILNETDTRALVNKMMTMVQAIPEKGLPGQKPIAGPGAESFWDKIKNRGMRVFSRVGGFLTKTFKGAFAPLLAAMSITRMFADALAPVAELLTWVLYPLFMPLQDALVKITLALMPLVRKMIPVFQDLAVVVVRAVIPVVRVLAGLLDYLVPILRGLLSVVKRFDPVLSSLIGAIVALTAAVYAAKVAMGVYKAGHLLYAGGKAILGGVLLKGLMGAAAAKGLMGAAAAKGLTGAAAAKGLTGAAAGMTVGKLGAGAAIILGAKAAIILGAALATYLAIDHYAKKDKESSAGLNKSLEHGDKTLDMWKGRIDAAQAARKADLMSAIQGGATTVEQLMKQTNYTEQFVKGALSAKGILGSQGKAVEASGKITYKGISVEPGPAPSNVPGGGESPSKQFTHPQPGGEPAPVAVRVESETLTPLAMAMDHGAAFIEQAIRDLHGALLNRDTAFNEDPLVQLTRLS
jgi:hypothetical protein